MHRLLLTLCVAVWILPFPATVRGEQPGDKRTDADAIQVAPADWPWWRGPHRNGIAAADQTPPLRWSKTDHVLWQSPIPGRGHGSPTVVGNQVFVATADEQREIQSVLCYDRQTGQQIWKTDVHTGGMERKGNKKSSQASASVACDGQRLFINFVNRGAVYTTALGRDGKQLWQTKITDYVEHQGYGSSPAPYRSVVIVSADNKGGGAVAALDRATGKIVWKIERPKVPNYASPIILEVAGREQLLMTGCDLVSGIDPLTGKKLWEIEGSTTECVTSTVTDGQLIFTSGGYPKNHITAVRADGSGKIVWENNVRVYVPSMLVQGGYLYSVTDAGVAMCWNCGTGEEVWKQRLGNGGTFSSSPVLVGEHFFVTNEAGTTFVFKANPKGCEVVAENQLGEEAFATPVICGSRIYLRAAAQQNGQRQETLYCLGEAAAVAPASAETKFQPEPGYALFFNGKDLSGWETKQGMSLENKSEAFNQRFRVSEEKLVIDPKVKGDVIIQTTKKFAKDVHLKFDFLPGPGCNNDLFFRGIKFDIKKGDVKNLKEGEWNEFEIIVTGDKAEFKSNGETQRTAPAKSDATPLGIRAEFGAIEFRRLRVKEGP